MSTIQPLWDATGRTRCCLHARTLSIETPLHYGLTCNISSPARILSGIGIGRRLTLSTKTWQKCPVAATSARSCEAWNTLRFSASSTGSKTDVAALENTPAEIGDDPGVVFHNPSDGANFLKIPTWYTTLDRPSLITAKRASIMSGKDRELKYWQPDSATTPMELP